jgi:hypothetical protein
MKGKGLAKKDHQSCKDMNFIKGKILNRYIWIQGPASYNNKKFVQLTKNLFLLYTLRQGFKQTLQGEKDD